MTAALFTPTDDQQFDALWGFLTGLFDPSLSGQFFKGYQNMTATPYNTYCVISRGVAEPLNQGERSYDASGMLQNVTDRIKVQWQIDTYGPLAVDWAHIIAGAWKSLWTADALRGTVITPLYADRPKQLNIVNGEDQYEARYMTMLYAQVVQIVGLPQAFFTSAEVTGNPVDITLSPD